MCVSHPVSKGLSVTTILTAGGLVVHASASPTKRLASNTDAHQRTCFQHCLQWSAASSYYPMTTDIAQTLQQALLSQLSATRQRADPHSVSPTHPPNGSSFAGAPPILSRFPGPRIPQSPHYALAPHLNIPTVTPLLHLSAGRAATHLLLLNVIGTNGVLPKMFNSLT